MAPGQELAPEWRRWVVENLLRGTEEAELCAELERAGVEAALARAAVRAEATDPYLQGAVKALCLRRKLEGLLDLYGDLYRQAEGHQRVDRHEALPAADFFERYYFQNRPVVVRQEPPEYVRVDGAREEREAAGVEVAPAPARHNVLLRQVHGRRTAWLVPAFELHRMSGPEAARVPRLEVALGPGDALLVPVGWWYGYRVEEDSATVRFESFTAPEPNVRWEPERTEPVLTPPPL
jgi:hypothetical protein